MFTCVYRILSWIFENLGVENYVLIVGRCCMKQGRAGQGTTGADRMQAGRELLEALQSELTAVPVTPLQMVSPEPLQAIPETTLHIELQSNAEAPQVSF